MFTEDILKKSKNGMGVQEAIYKVPSHMSEMHYHSHYEILHVTHNSRKLFVGDRVYRLDNTNVALIPPFIPHMTTSGGTVPEKRIMIDFYESYVHDVRKYLFSDVLSCFVAPCNVLSIDKIKKEFYEIIEKIKSDSCSDFAENGRLLSLCLLLNLLSSVSESGNTMDEFSEIIKFVESNFDKKITLDFLAGKFYLSKFTLSRYFSKYTGTSLPKYLNTIRVINAKKHLDSGKSVTETAMLCGFDATSSFDRVFKVITGVSPSKYKSENKKQK